MDMNPIVLNFYTLHSTPSISRVIIEIIDNIFIEFVGEYIPFCEYDYYHDEQTFQNTSFCLSSPNQETKAFL